jgi:hypothetical protein
MVTIFRDVEFCKLEEVDQRKEASRRRMKVSLLHFLLPILLFASSAYISSTNMEATRPSETSVDFY